LANGINNRISSFCKDRQDIANHSRLEDARTVAGNWKTGNWTRKLGKLGISREYEVKSGKWV
jgi:hypothetical protein